MTHPHVCGVTKSCACSMTRSFNFNMIHSYVCGMTNLCVCAITGSYMCNMTHPCVCGMTNSCVCAMTHSYMCNMTHPYVRGVTKSCVCTMTHLYVCNVTHPYVCNITYLATLSTTTCLVSEAWLNPIFHVTRYDIFIRICHTGWRRLIGSHKCRPFSTKEPLNVGHFCGKWHIKIRDPMSLRHPVPRDVKYLKMHIHICLVWDRTQAYV